MLHLTILAVGGLKERYLTDACSEYSKRLGASCKLTVLELPEHRLPAAPSPAQIQQALRVEGDAILSKVPKGAYVLALCIEGELLTSERLAVYLCDLPVVSSHLVFVIGGSHGLSDALKARADKQISMSRMTFPHQLVRVMLLEQLYRAFSINAGTKYHK